MLFVEEHLSESLPRKLAHLIPSGLSWSKWLSPWTKVDSLCVCVLWFPFRTYFPMACDDLAMKGLPSSDLLEPFLGPQVLASTSQSSPRPVYLCPWFLFLYFSHETTVPTWASRCPAVTKRSFLFHSWWFLAREDPDSYPCFMSILLLFCW